MLAYFAKLLPSQISVATVDDYKLSKLRDRERLEDQRRHAQPGEWVDRGLSNGSVNKTLKVLAMILDDAIEAGYVETNVARGKRRRLKESKPRRTWLELYEIRALLDAAGTSRALFATMILGGLRVGELSQLRWRAVDLARGKLTVEHGKTDASSRLVDVSPMLLAELKLHKTSSDYTGPDELVFCTSKGTRLDRGNIRTRARQGD